MPTHGTCERRLKAESRPLTVCIGANHPALAGHFPGNPLVPGVVLLSKVIGLVQTKERIGTRVKALSGVKFLAHVRPDETLSVTVSPVRPGAIRFGCWRASTLVAAGSLELEVRRTEVETIDVR